MKYHIDTIPVWDAYHQGGECPLCNLENRLEKSYVDSFLGASVMEPDTRIEVNKTGFCPHHFKLLYDAQNRLGLALMTHTHLKEFMEKFEQRCNAVLKTSKARSAFALSSIIRGKKDMQQLTAELEEWLTVQHHQCIICNRMSNTMNRYAYTILYLWDTDKEFKKAFESSKGFCLKHLTLTIKIARETLPAHKQALWLADVIPLQIKSFHNLEQELYQFINKFDYRNQNKPLGSAKNSLPRTIQKLTGKFMD
ncbi:hypothetical protein KVG29_00585 [Caldicoprobacter algeriensis]|uniref:DUF6062 family protein n=1 Tax=Caldicoprobacter algeriensis TaxID=699281 RepID=UPI002079A0AB|nr:DUF6062 family protein [Caldicoprobacter algeriensis]MCM8899720.1 hypothetical protein [Caldicoprobacter algeriensis]